MNEILNTIRDTAKETIAPFRRTEPQREAARVLGRLGLGTMGFGSAAAAVMMLRRKNERELLDEEKAQALLEVPIYVPSAPNKKERKSASGVSKAIAAGLGVLGLGGTAAGLALSNGKTDGNTSANPASRVFNTATGVVPYGNTLREEQERVLDMPGTIRGEHAKDFLSVPWFVPGALGVSMLGLGAGYSGVNAIGNAMAKQKLKRKKKKVEQFFADALRKEAQSELGSVLEEFVTVCEELAPSVKEASLIEWYLALLGTAGVAGGMAGAYHGYQGATQKHRLSALKKIRQLQLAKRRSEELSLVPRFIPVEGSSQDDSKKMNMGISDAENGDEKETNPMKKSADLVREMAKGLWKGTKYLGGKAIQGASSAARGTGQAASYLAREQPVTTLAVGGLLGAEGVGRLADRSGSPIGQWKPSTWVFNRFAENKPLTDTNGNPIHGTRRMYSGDPRDFAEMKWSWNPLSERGFGWRFRREPRLRRRVMVSNSEPSITELVEKSNPSITMRRRMNERFYDYDQRADAGSR